MTFKAGDVVRLKSGGPKMTVIELVYGKAGHHYLCCWFGNSNVRQHDSFHLDTLELLPTTPATQQSPVEAAVAAANAALEASTVKWAEPYTEDDIPF